MLKGVIIGYIMNQNMSPFINSRQFSLENINYLDLVQEQIKPEVIFHQIQLLLSLIPKN